MTPATRLLPLYVIPLVCLAVPTGIPAQTTADRESIRSVVDLLFLNADSRELSADQIARHPGIWSVVIARFAKGDSREIEIPAEVDERYRVEGASDSDGTDVDICVYSPEGDQIACDTEEDNFPITGFIAETAGVYRVVMTAASVEGGGTSFAGMVVFRVSGLHRGPWSGRLAPVDSPPRRTRNHLVPRVMHGVVVMGLLAGSHAVPLVAQPQRGDGKDFAGFTLMTEQDFLLRRGNEDRNYTMGVGFGFSGELGYDSDGVFPPWRITALLPVVRQGLDRLIPGVFWQSDWMQRTTGKSEYSWMFGTTAFTPDDLANPDPISA